MQLIAALLMVMALAGCTRDAKRSPSTPAAPATVENAAIVARAELEVVAQDLSAGTNKYYSRADFLPLDDPRARSAGDFIGRLRALFGPVDHDRYVLRHRATGLIITAYAAQSGPSYGGPATAPNERKARLAADPELGRNPVDWSTISIATISDADLRELRTKETAWMKRVADAVAPPGFSVAVARLDQLVSSVPPVDWEATWFHSEIPTIYRIGARASEGFDQDLSVPDGLAFLLAQADGKTPPIVDSTGHPTDAIENLLAYWVYHRDDDMVRYQPGEDAAALRAAAVRALDAALPRVQAAWFRKVGESRALDAKERAGTLEYARELVEPLQLDEGKAEAALEAAAAP